MKITVRILPDKTIKEISLQKQTTVEHILSKLNLKPDTVIIMRNKTPIPLDESVDRDQELEIIRVASGG